MTVTVLRPMTMQEFLKLTGSDAPHDVALFECHPHDADRYYQDRGSSTVYMPDESLVLISKRAPDELAFSMTREWAEAWALERAS